VCVHCDRPHAAVADPRCWRACTERCGVLAAGCWALNDTVHDLSPVQGSAPIGTCAVTKAHQYCCIQYPIHHRRCLQLMSEHTCRSNCRFNDQARKGNVCRATFQRPGVAVLSLLAGFSCVRYAASGAPKPPRSCGCFIEWCHVVEGRVGVI
jgi:hypothetical protein